MKPDRDFPVPLISNLLRMISVLFLLVAALAPAVSAAQAAAPVSLAGNSLLQFREEFCRQGDITFYLFR